MNWLAQLPQSWLFRPVVATFVVMLLFLGRTVWGAQHLEGCISPEVKAQLEREGSDNVQVILHPKPEQFNLVFLKNLGNFAGIEDRTVKMFDVDRAGIETICRQYWVERVIPWQGS